jgi:small-conductance mechanosensitive channel
LPHHVGLLANPVVWTTLAAIAAVAVTLLLHAVLNAVMRRVVRHQRYAQAFLSRSIAPLRLLLPMLALQAVFAAAPDDYLGLAAWRHATTIGIIIGVTWLAVNALVGIRDVILLRFPSDVADNLEARRIRTQASVLMRTLCGLASLIGVAAVLMTFPGVRQIGASLLASAGLAGLVVGFAAKPVLGNLIAGLQLAVAQPIRIDDVVIVEGEWGRVEEITGAFVVVRIWDERRLIVPLQWFIEHPFQNWTRTGSQILGTVFLWVDYRLALAPVRAELERLCAEAPEWDKRVCGLQVTDVSERAMQLRALVSAADAGQAWNLRCRVREGLIAFLQANHPDALPRIRTELSGAAAMTAP